MTPTLGSLKANWTARTPRERLSLLIMAGALAAFGYWFLLAAPLRSLAADAEQRHLRAAIEAAGFGPTLEEIAKLQSPASRGGDTAMDSSALVLLATEMGLVVRASESAESGSIVLQFEAAPPAALFAWVTQVRQQFGLRPLRAHVERGDSGLQGELTFPLAPQ